MIDGAAPARIPAPMPIPPLCLILQPVHPAAAQALAQGGLDVLTAPAAADADAGRVVAVISRNAPVDGAFLDRHPALRVVAKHGTGLDAIDVAEARRRGVQVVYTPGANAQAVAEHVLALILALAKRLRPADAAVRGGDFAYKFRARFDELAGARLGIVGLGASGQKLATMARLGLGMEVAAHSPSVPAELFHALGVERAPDLTALLETSDVVSLHVPARPGARGMIGPAELAVLRPGALLISVGRGGVVDEAALAAALAAGHLGGAALDVFDQEPPAPDNPLFGLADANLILTPHVAGNTQAALRRMALGVATQIIDVLAGRPPAHPAP
ncbi:NAD(P)-dependent oxidoreductase [Novispirillum sp. DQ9]|uniref:NAD(P)-dependent oxidoreductase n=1 Tax=Novispirillum sp. DQ9 TaxID=3398612 RepID=UPI003C7EAAA3